MRISDWSSVVCSSDLPAVGERAALDRRAAVIGDEAAAIDAATNVLALQRVRKEAEVDVDQIGGAAIDGNVIAGLPRPRRRDLRFEIAGDEGGGGADLHGAEDRKSTSLNSSHQGGTRRPASACNNKHHHI